MCALDSDTPCMRGPRYVEPKPRRLAYWTALIRDLFDTAWVNR